MAWRDYTGAVFDHRIESGIESIERIRDTIPSTTFGSSEWTVSYDAKPWKPLGESLASEMTRALSTNIALHRGSAMFEVTIVRRPRSQPSPPFLTFSVSNETSTVALLLFRQLLFAFAESRQAYMQSAAQLRYTNSLLHEGVPGGGRAVLPFTPPLPWINVWSNELTEAIGIDFAAGVPEDTFEVLARFDSGRIWAQTTVREFDATDDGHRSRIARILDQYPTLKRG